MTFFRFAVKAVLTETPENFADMFLMVRGVVRINEYVVEVDDDIDVQ